jgi:DNA-binding MarR family transcriptional regulator
MVNGAAKTAVKRAKQCKGVNFICCLCCSGKSLLYGYSHLPEFLKQDMLSFINRANGAYMDRVIAAQVYNRICELGSLSAAARALGISRPMVSRYLEQMEKWAGTRLVNRSTRKLTLTAAGEKCAAKNADALAARRKLKASRKRLPSARCGGLRALYRHAPDCAGAARLLSRYPQLRIELDVNNHPVSLVGAY